MHLESGGLVSGTYNGNTHGGTCCIGTYINMNMTYIWPCLCGVYHSNQRTAGINARRTADGRTIRRTADRRKPWRALYCSAAGNGHKSVAWINSDPPAPRCSTPISITMPVVSALKNYYTQSPLEVFNGYSKPLLGPVAVSLLKPPVWRFQK